MKNLRVLTWLLAVLITSTAAHATPIQYQTTARYVYSPNVPGTTPSDLFLENTPIAITLTYNSATPLIYTTYVGAEDLSIFAPFNYYMGAVSNLSGSVLGNSFSAHTADALTSAQGDVWLRTGFGSTFSSPAHSSLQSFYIGNFALVGILGQMIHTDRQLQLPTQLSSSGAYFFLIFKDSVDNYSYQAFYSESVAPVPLPSAALFFLSGLIGLGANAVRKLKR